MAEFENKVRQKLSENGYAFYRHGKGDHDIWKNNVTGRCVTVDGTIKAIPHNYCRVIASANFSSDCRKLRSNTVVFQGVFGKNDGKFASKRRQSPKGGNCAVLP